MDDDLLSSPGPLDAHLDRAQTRDRLRFLADYGVDLSLTRATLAATPAGQLSEVMDILSLRARTHDPVARWPPSREPVPDFPRDAMPRGSRLYRARAKHGYNSDGCECKFSPVHSLLPFSRYYSYHGRRVPILAYTTQHQRFRVRLS